MRIQWSRDTWFLGAVLAMAVIYTLAFRRIAIPDWILLIDFSLSLPLLHYFLCRPTFKQWLIRWIKLTGFGIFLGSLIIPESSRVLWPMLEKIRHTVMGMLIPVEVGIGVWIVYAISKLLRWSNDIDLALKTVVIKYLGRSPSAHLALFEARIWQYAFFNTKRATYAGDLHFSYAKQNGNASSQLGFIMAMLFEMPLAHLLLHFIWSPKAAWIASGVTLWGMVYLIAEYRATWVRPISIDRHGVHIRCGVLAADAFIPWQHIAAVARHQGPVARQRGVRRYKQLGECNIAIDLRPGIMLPDMFGRQQPVSRLYMGLDDPDGFIKAAAIK